jgi:4-amino-4-deoxy-L-arabinose transferase-like glycosyltransferase
MVTRTLRLNSVLTHAIVLITVSLPYCINLGKSSIWDANEAFYAETPREMLVTGNYIAPQFNFRPRAQKPPLTYWIILISYKIFGVCEFAVRFPSTLAALGTVLFSYGTARLLFGPRAALFSAVITGTTARIFILARRLPIDILLLLFLTAAFYFLVRSIQNDSRRDWAFFYMCSGFGFLTKGPIAVLIPAACYLLWALCGSLPAGIEDTSGRMRTAVRRLRAARFKTGLVLFFCLVLPWYVMVYFRYGWTYISPFFLRDNFGRFAAESLGPSRSLLYYIPIFGSDFFPWSLLIIPALYFFWKYRSEEIFSNRFPFQFPLIWCAVIFVFFSLSKNKQDYYIAPIYPVAAALLAGIVDRYAGRKEKRQPSASAAPWFWMYGFLAVLLLFLSTVIPFALSSFMPGISPVLHYSPSIVLLGGIMLLIWNMIRRKQVWCFSVLAASLWAIYLVCALLYLPALEAFRPVKGFCRRIDTEISQGDEAGFYGTALPSMAFYLRRPIFEENNPEEMLRRFRSGKRVFCILSHRDLGYFAGQKSLELFILDRHPRFAVHLNTLLNAGYFPGEELLLISNRRPGRSVSGRSSTKL